MANRTDIMRQCGQGFFTLSRALCCNGSAIACAKAREFAPLTRQTRFDLPVNKAHATEPAGATISVV